MIATVPADPQPRVDVATPQATLPPPERREPVFEIQGLTASYGATPALSDVGMQIYENLVTAVIGPGVPLNGVPIITSPSTLKEAVPVDRFM